MTVSTLIERALNGDIESLRQAHKKNAEDLLSCARNCVRDGSSNFIHVAVAENNCEFLAVALGILPQELLLDLLCQKDSNGSNPFHCAAKEGNIFTVQLLVKAYVKIVTTAPHKQHTSPLVMKNFDERTPLLCCFANINEPHESVARHLVSLDHHLLEVLCKKRHESLYPQGRISTEILDKDFRSPVFCAMLQGFSLLVIQILDKEKYSLDGSSGETPLHYASKCSEQVSKKLLEKRPKLIGRVTINGESVLHRAVSENAAWLVKLMLMGDEKGNRQPWNKACRRLIWYTDLKSTGAKTPLHIAAERGYIDIAKLVIKGYKLALQDEPSDWLDDEAYYPKYGIVQRPWEIKNFADDIPLFTALKSHHDDFGVYMLSLQTSSNIISLELQDCKSIHKLAILNSCPQSAKKIFEKTVSHRADILLKLSTETRDMHLGVLSIITKIAMTYKERSVELTAEMVDKLEEVVSEFTSEPRNDGISHLVEAARKGEDWLVKFYLEGDKSLIEKSTQAWKITCENGHISTLLTFIEQCDDHDHFIRLCRRNRQTPLHHVRNLLYEQYKELLENPALKALVNEIDNDGSTPLHKAIQSVDLGLTKALLETTGIKLDVENRSRKTALDLLETPLCISNVGFLKLYKELLTSSIMTVELKNRVDSDGATSLHRAIQRNSRKLVEILIETKGIDFEIKDKDGRTALGMIEEQSKHKSVGHFWFEQYKKLLENADMLQKLMNHKGSSGSTPLHLAIEWDDLKLAKMLLKLKELDLKIKDTNEKVALDLIEERCNHSESSWFELYKEILVSSLMTHELKNRIDSNGDTALHRAINRNFRWLVEVLMQTKGVKLEIKDISQKTALDMIEERCNQKSDDLFWFQQYKKLLVKPDMLPKLKNRTNSSGTTPFHLAVEWDDINLGKRLVQTKGLKFNIIGPQGKTALDLIEEQYSQPDSLWYELYNKVLENTNNARELKNHVGHDGDTPLHRAIKQKDLKLVKTLLETKGIDLKIKDRHDKTAVNLLEEQYSQHDQLWKELYRELLDNPEHKHELKNGTGRDGDTPLHRAIKQNDLKLAKTLLETKGVELDIEDASKKTALDLLEERHKRHDWAEMCREIRLDPTLKIFKFKYLQRRTSLQDMQNTLSVMAILLATITFTAGITVPGGFDSKGTATLGTHTAFIVFFIVNSLAFCCSMAVLFSLVGAMMWEAHPKATSSVDLCLFLLHLSFFGTILAFMAGIYAIMAHKVKGVAIVGMALCSVSFVLAFYQVCTFWPPLYKPWYWLKNSPCISGKCGKDGPSTTLFQHVSQLNTTVNSPSKEANVPRLPNEASLQSHPVRSLTWRTPSTGKTLSVGLEPAALENSQQQVQTLGGATSEHGQEQLQNSNTKLAAIFTEPFCMV